MQKIIDLIEAGKLTDEYEKKFIRSAATLNSVNKDTLHRQFNELYDRLKLFEDMYFEINERVKKMLAAAGKKAVQKFITTHDAPVPPKLGTVTYAEDRLRYFEEHREVAKWTYEATESACRNSKRLNRQMEEELSDAGRVLQYYDDVVAMLKADVAPVLYGRWINSRDGNATCNVCGVRQRGVYDDDNEQRHCGKCGAKMNGGTKCKND